MRRPRSTCALLSCLVIAGASCDRKIEPFDPNEQPREPDLSKIFPEGADSAEAIEPSLPAPPGETRGVPPPVAEATAEGSDAPITGTVALAPELAGKAPPDAVLFVIARRGGGGPPLAVKRFPSPTFPLSFEIGPGDRMIQSVPFSGPISLSARVDTDGNATSRSPGDLMGSAQGGPVSPGATGVAIVLDTPL